MSQEAHSRNEAAKPDGLRHFSGVTDPDFASGIAGSRFQCSLIDTASSFLTWDTVNPVSSIRQSAVTDSSVEPPAVVGKSSSESFFAQLPAFPLQTLVLRESSAESGLMQASPGITEAAEFNVGRTEEASGPAILFTRPPARNLSLKPQLETTGIGRIQRIGAQVSGLRQTEASSIASSELEQDEVSGKLSSPRAVVAEDAPSAATGQGLRSVLPDSVVRIIGRHVDMPHVRIHSDASASFMASKLNAEAFTIGSDVFFASGKLDLSTPRGVALLGHELTHVRQHQEPHVDVANAGRTGTLRRSALESEAVANERAILSSLSSEPQMLTYSQTNSPVIGKKADVPGFRQVELTHIGVPQIQRIVSEAAPNILKAEPGRDLSVSAPSEPPESTLSELTSPEPDINRIAEQVYEIIEDKLRREKERHGYF